MPRLDLNELSAFVSTTDNAPYLIDLYNHVADNLGRLGVQVAKYQPVPLAEGPARSPALAEEPGPDLFTPPAAPPVSLVEEPPTIAQDERGGVEAADDPLEVREPPMPDYSVFPEGLRLRLEEAWLARRGG